VLTVMFTNALDLGTTAVLFPVYAKDVLHSSVALGLMAGVFAGVAVAGNTVFGWVGGRLRRWPTLTLAFLIVGAPRYLVVAAEPGLPAILATMLVTGLACGAINPILSVVEYRRIPEDLRAKVFGVMTGGVLAVAPLGAVLGGAAVAALGLTGTLLLVGGLYLLATLCPVVFPVWREMDAL
jgi:MFS family permease